MAGLLDFLFGAGPLKSAAGGPQADDNFKPGSVSDAQRNADYAAKKLGKQPTAPAAAKSPAPKPITVTKKKPTSVEQGVGGQLMQQE